MGRQIIWLAVALVLTLPLAACSGRSPASSTPVPTPEITYTNPIFERDFPDPFILRAGDAFYGYATNARHMNIQVIRSTNLVDWERVGTDGDALPELPEWAAPRRFLTWAPSALQRGDEFILYYTTRFVESGRQCISYAVSDAPDGPFVDPNDAPLICQLDEGGSIDPEPFLDEDGSYLLWKSDANALGQDAWLYSQRLSEDGRTLLDEPMRLIQRDQEWERPLIENPTMTQHGGRYYLFYSANWWESGDYAVGYAVCDSPLGPCTKPQDGPILESTGDHLGPGGASFFRDVEGRLRVAYHAWLSPNTNYNMGGARSLHLGYVEFQEGVPVIYRPEAQD